MIDGKPCVAIVSCNPTYAGLDIGTWAVNFVVFAFFLSIVTLFTKSTLPIYCCVGVQVILNIVYVKVFLKLEENIGAVLLNNLSIPGTIYGYFVRLPSKPKVSSEDGGEEC